MRAPVIAVLILGLTATAIADGPDLAKLRSAVRAQPDDPAARRALGWALLEFAHDPDLAYKELREAARLDPADLGGCKLLATAAAATGRLDMARRLFDSVLTRDPEDIWMWVSLGNTLAASHRDRAAQAAYQQALRRNPRYSPALTGLEELTARSRPRVDLSAGSLTDLTGFRSSYANISVDAPVSSTASLVASATGSLLEQGSASALHQDVGLTLQFNLAPSLVFQSLVQQSCLSKRAVVSEGLGMVWSRGSRAVAINFRRHEPVYAENMAISRLGLVETGLAVGADWPIIPSITAQGAFAYSRYSDDNQKRSGFVQITGKVMHQPWLVARIRYETLSFTQQQKSYFTPAFFQFIRPEVAVDHPLARHLGMEAQIGVPFVMGRFSPGWLVTAGPHLACNRFKMQIQYFNSRILSVQSWSQHGLQVQMSRGL